MMHAPEILNDIWMQRGKAYTKHYKPALRIWISREDFKVIMRETLLIPGDTDITAVLYAFKPFRLFGEEAIVSLDVSDGEPIVEVISHFQYGS